MMRSVKAIFDYFVGQVQPEPKPEEKKPIPSPEPPVQEEIPTIIPTDQYFNAPQPVTPEAAPAVAPQVPVEAPTSEVVPPEQLFPAEQPVTPESALEVRQNEFKTLSDKLDEQSAYLGSLLDDVEQEAAAVGEYVPASVMQNIADPMNYNAPMQEGIQSEGVKFNNELAAKIPEEWNMQARQILENYQKTGQLQRTGNPIIDSPAQMAIMSMPSEGLPIAAHPSQAGDYYNEVPSRYDIPLSKASIKEENPFIRVAALLVDAAEKEEMPTGIKDEFRIVQQYVEQARANFEEENRVISTIQRRLMPMYERFKTLRGRLQDFQKKKATITQQVQSGKVKEKTIDQATQYLTRLTPIIERIQTEFNQLRAEIAPLVKERDTRVREQNINAIKASQPLGDFYSKYATNPDKRVVKLANAVHKSYEELIRTKFGKGGLFGSNTKLDKPLQKAVNFNGKAYTELLMTGLSLSPHTSAGYQDLCTHATAMCRAFCLQDSGQGEGFEGSDAGLVPKEARKRKTFLWKLDPVRFYDGMSQEVGKFKKKAAKMGKLPAMRLNVLSDILWEKWKPDGQKNTIFEEHPDVQFYDYTKVPDRYIDFLTQKQFDGQQLDPTKPWPKNYHLTASFSEVHMPMALMAVEMGGQVALVFDTPTYKENSPEEKKTELPPNFFGYKVVNADETDARFLDHEYFEVPPKQGMFCGLRFKGRKAQNTFKAQKKEEVESGKGYGEVTGGFTQYADWAGMDETNKKHNPAADKFTKYDETGKVVGPNFDAMFDMLHKSEARRMAQIKDGKTGGWSPHVLGLIGNVLYYKWHKKFGAEVANRFKQEFPQFFTGADGKEIDSRYWNKWLELGFLDRLELEG